MTALRNSQANMLLAGEVAVYRAQRDLDPDVLVRARAWTRVAPLTWIFHAALEGAAPKKLMTSQHIEILDRMVKASAVGKVGR